MPDDPNVSEQTLIECIVSARFWTDRLGPYSANIQAISDRYAISASLISTITGLAAWGMIAGSPRLWAQVLVGLMAVATAAVTVIPKVIGYSECAFNAAGLSGEYGKVLGKLQDALEALLKDDPKAQTYANAARNEFNAIKERKDHLRPFPTGEKKQIDQQRPQVMSEEKAAVAKRKAELQKRVA